jgi:hypothetical protein
MIECPKCKSPNAVKGHLATVGQSSRLSASFWPEAVKWHHFVFDHGPVVESDACACPDCGMIWLSLKDVTDLRHILNQTGKKTERDDHVT